MIDTETIKQIKRMREKGASINCIARESGLSRPTIYKYLAPTDDDPEVEQPHPAPKFEQRAGQTYPLTPKKAIPVDRPSERVVKQREDVEIVGLEVEKQKSLKELEKVTGQMEHPALVEKRARVEVAKLDLDEYEARKRLEALKEEERRKARAEEEARIQKEIERERIEDERREKEAYEKWIKGYQERALRSWLPWRIEIPTALKFQVKDAVRKTLENRFEYENASEIEVLIKETISTTLEPYLNEQQRIRRAEEAEQREKRKARLKKMLANRPENEQEMILEILL